jgi:hypothetical protein
MVRGQVSGDCRDKYQRGSLGKSITYCLLVLGLGKVDPLMLFCRAVLKVGAVSPNMGCSLTWVGLFYLPHPSTHVPPLPLPQRKH